ncbi:MAG: hypothetical protein J5654_05370 [Victivallales bacterium]|nr:hypothetical protein [Victivallales bacterium]
MPKAISRETRLHHACHLRTLRPHGLVHAGEDAGRAADGGVPRARRPKGFPFELSMAGHQLVRSMAASPGMDFACFACFAGNTTRQPSAVGNHNGKLMV